MPARSAPRGPLPVSEEAATPAGTSNAPRAPPDLILHGLRRRAQRARRVDDVVHDDRRLVAHVADHVGDLGDLLRGALLVEDRELAADLLRELLGQLHAAEIG